MLKQENIYSIKSKADKVLAVIILAAALPFSLLTAIVLTLILKSTPLIVQERGITEENKVFKIYKFRTMKRQAESSKEEKEKDILYKRYLAEYVPVFCRWLRKTGLDELPQIINVIKGEMSLIGPRPLMMSDLEILRKRYPEYYRVRGEIKVKPGITGLWQVYGRREEGIENLLHLDREYDREVSFGLDARIFLSTIPLIFRGKHSDAVISGMRDEERKQSSREGIVINSVISCEG